MWENLAAEEIEFYKHKDEHLKEIEDRLEEIEETSYVFSIGYFDGETGLYRRSGMSVEDQVIEKVMKEKGVLKLKDKLLERCDRIEYAFTQLEDYEFHLIDKYYLKDQEDGITQRTVKETVRTLRKIYRIILLQKTEGRQKQMEALEQERQERFKGLRQAYQDGSLYKTYKPKPKESEVRT